MLREKRFNIILTILINFCLLLSISHANAAEKYAVLISTGETHFDDQAMHSEYWYDLFLMYETLTEQGYTHDNIYVLYGDGNDFASRHDRYNVKKAHPEWPEQITDYNNLKDTIRDGFKYLGGDPNQGIPALLTEEDDLFIWLMGHGGLRDISSDPNCSDICCTTGGCCPDVWFPTQHLRDDISEMNEEDIDDPNFWIREAFNDKDFKDYVSQIASYNHRCLSIATCHSGGIINEFQSDPNTIISTAVHCGENVGSAIYEFLDGGEIFHSEYNYNFRTPDP